MQPPEPTVRLLLVDYQGESPVEEHPDVAPLLADGWALRSAEPRLVEGEGPKLLVSLARPDAPPS